MDVDNGQISHYVVPGVVLSGDVGLIFCPAHTGNFSHPDSKFFSGELWQFKDTTQCPLDYCKTDQSVFKIESVSKQEKHSLTY